MFSVLTSSGADQVSIALVLESHAAIENGNGTDVRPSKKQTIGRAKLPISALSLYMENQNSGKSTSIGIEMDYQPLSEDV